MDREDRKFARALWIIAFLAVVLRLASALYQGNEVESLPGVADQISYHRLSTRVLNGYGFSFEVGWWPATPAGQPTAHWSYLYVLFLTAVYTLFGPNPVAARIIQAVLVGVLQPLFTWRIGRRLFGKKAGIVAAALSACYGYFAYYGGALMTESFHIAAILWVVDIATGIAGSSNRKSGMTGMIPWVQLGVACAAAVLLRQVFLLLVPVILLWLAWRLVGANRLLSIPQFLGRSMIVPGVLILCIAPWTIRNYRAFDAFVLLNTNAGFAFFWGNHPVHGTKFIPILSPAEYGILIPAEVRGLNEAKMDRALLARGLDFVRDSPVRYIRLSMSRTIEYFKFWPTVESSTLSNLVRVLSFGLVFPLVLAGFFLLYTSCVRRKGLRHESCSPGVSLLLLLGGFYTLLHIMTWTLIRYRLPMDAIFMPLAAVSTAAAYDWLKKKVGGQPAGDNCGSYSRDTETP